MTTREASQRNEASIAMSPAMETQDDSVDLSYLKQVALEVGNVRSESPIVSFLLL